MEINITVGELYQYPITLTSKDFAENGIHLDLKLTGDGDLPGIIRNFLNTIHQHLYDFLIYSTGNRNIKDRILETYREQLERPVKRALLIQGKYIIESNDIGLWNGVLDTVGGVEVKDVQDIIEKIICPQAFNILNGTVPNILYAGG